MNSIRTDALDTSSRESSVDTSISSKGSEKARRRYRVITSCLECRRRKLKCDKAAICQNCRTYKRQCVYITSANTNDSQLRRKLTQMKDARDSLEQNALLVNPEEDPAARQEKLSKLSGAPIANLSGVTGNHSDESDVEGYLEPTALAIPDAAYAEDDSEVVDDLGVAFGRIRLGERIGGFFRPRIGDEIGQSLQNQQPKTPGKPSSVHRRPASAISLDSAAQSSSAPSLNLLLGQQVSNDDWISYLPARATADKLLEQYWIAVHPIARTLHRPSFAQRYETLWELLDNGAEIPASLGAIVLSVMLSAAVSISRDEKSSAQSQSMSEMIAPLKQGTEIALGQANLLISNKTETLQAFVTYLLPLCVDEISRSHSALVGLAVRLAECMGYHRDPIEHGFSTAETQVRRLIWYQICYLDWRTSEVQGPRPFIQVNGYTTKLPLEITASQSPSATPSSSSSTTTRWNDMIFSVIRFECQEMHRTVLTIRTKVDRKRLSITAAVSKVEAFSKDMHAKYDGVLNATPQQPLQHAARVTMNLFINLLYLNLLHRYMNSVTYRVPDRLRQIVIIKGTEAFEAAVELETADDLRSWAWYTPAYQHYHIALLLLFEVFTFPLRKEANRIWECLDFVFAEPLASLTDLPNLESRPRYHELIAYRDVKARYLLGLIVKQMKEYRNVRKLRSPVKLDDTMILITPQKVGDDSDPSLPLNFAHENDQEQQQHRQQGQWQESSQEPVHDLPASDAEFPSVEMRVPGDSFQNQPVYEGIMQNAWMAQDPPSFQSQPRSVPERHYSGIQYSNHPTATRLLDQDHNVNTIAMNSPHPFPQTPLYSPQTGFPGQENQLEELEIDWEFWDSMFSSGDFDGDLDLSDVDMQGYVV